MVACRGPAANGSRCALVFRRPHDLRDARVGAVDVGQLLAVGDACEHGFFGPLHAHRARRRLRDAGRFQDQDAVLIRVSGKFEGMPWIDVAEPRSRRSDKLLKGPR